MRPRFTVPSMHVWRTQHTTERETHIDTTCTKLVSNCNSKPYWRLVLPTTQAARRPHSAGIPPEVNRERVWSSLTDTVHRKCRDWCLSSLVVFGYG